MRLAGKTAIVTGAARGIGRAIAVEFAREGADIAIFDVAESADETVAAVGELGRRALFVHGSVTDREAVAAMVDHTASTFGSVDILVNNAALNRRGAFLELDPDVVRRIWDVSMWGTFHASQLAARRMVAQGRGGNIVCIGSVHGSLAYPLSTAYNGAKAAINLMAATWAVELAPYRIRVNTIEPGWIDTPGERLWMDGAELEAHGAELLMGRLGRAEEIARGAVYLASEDASYVTGTVLRIDGGYVLPRVDV